MSSAKKRKKTVFLHIGFFKTGTSAVQELLYINRSHLKANNYYYPDLGCNHHNCLPAMMAFAAGSPVPPVSRMDECQKGAEEIWNEIINGFEESSLDNMIISAEMFIDFSFKEQYHYLVDEVGKYLSKYQVTVIVYLREHISYIRSMYQQIIKDGDIFTREEAFILNHLNGWHLSFYPTLQNWARVFGKENMVVDIYEGKKYGVDGLYKDFFGKIGLCWDDSYTLPVKNKNISVSAEWVEAKRVFNLIKKAPNPVRWLMDDQSSTPGFGDEDIEIINASIQKDIEKVEGEFRLSSGFKFAPLSCHQFDDGIKTNKDILDNVALLLLADRAIRGGDI